VQLLLTIACYEDEDCQQMVRKAIKFDILNTFEIYPADLIFKLT